MRGTSTSGGRRYTYLLLMALVLLAFTLRVVFLDKQSLWGDEAASLSYAQSDSLLELLRRVVTTDPHPPLYYAILQFWIPLAGTDDFLLRWPSLLFGVLTVSLAYSFGRRLFGAVKPALLLTFFATIAPFLVYYSQEARMYAMAAFLCLLALYTVARSLDGGGRWWLVYSAAGAAAVFTLTVAAIVIAAAAAFVLLTYLQRQQDVSGKAVLRLLVSTIVVLAAYLTWQALQLERTGTLVSIAPLSSLPILAVDFVKEAALVNVFGLTLDPAYTMDRKYQDISSWQQVFDPAYTTVAAGLALGIAVCGLVSALKGKGLLQGWLPVLILLMTWGGTYILRITTSRYAPRLLFVGAPVFLGLLSLGLLALPWRALRILALVGLAVGMGYSLWLNYQDPAFSRSEYRYVARYLDQEIESGDGVFLHGPPVRLLHNHYLPQPHEAYSIPKSLPVQQNKTEVEAQLKTISKRHARLWLVLGGETDYDPERWVERWLLEHGFQLEDQWFGNTRLALFVFPGEETSRSLWQGIQLGRDLALVDSAVFQDRPFTPDDGLPLSFTWRAISATQMGYRLSLRLVDSEGQIWSQRDQDLGGSLNPVVRWPLGELVTTRTGLRVPPGTPPGAYFLKSLVYEASGHPLDKGDLGLAPIQVETGRPVTVGRVRPSQRADVPLGQFRIIGYDFPKKVRPGEASALRLYWATEESPSVDYSLTVSFGKGPGGILPILPSYPTSWWHAGEAVITQHRVRTSAGASGRQSLSIGLKGPAETGLFLLTEVEVVEVKRNFQEPRAQRTYEAVLGGKVKLIGLDLDRPVGDKTAPAIRPGTSVRMVVYWKALQEMDTSYTVFAQLLDSSGRLVAQDDSIPAHGERPTTGWVLAEVVSDEHVLRIPEALPPGRYNLIAGMYHAASGRRLDTAGGDFVPLVEIVVGNE